jgi:hypothetical protein
MAAPYTLTRHALSRALDMALDGEEIRKAIFEPESTGWSLKYECETRTAGRVTVSCRRVEDTVLVVTILWATPEAWEADYKIAPLPGGRTPRDMSDWKTANGNG